MIRFSGGAYNLLFMFIIYHNSPYILIFSIFASVKQNLQFQIDMDKISKLYYCFVDDADNYNNRLMRVDNTSIVRLRVNDFARLCSAGFRVVIVEHSDFWPDNHTYNNALRRSVRVANFIIINRKLPPKL